VLDPVTGKQDRGWLGLVWGFLFLSRSCRMCKKKCVFYGLIVMKLIGFFCEHFLLWRGDEEENWVWKKNWQAEDKLNREIQAENKLNRENI
jgi:hypothetical protein